MTSFRFRNGDWHIGGNGKLIQATDKEVLEQDVKKILNTDQENDINMSMIPFRYNSGYGTNLNFIKALYNFTSVENVVSGVRGEVKNAILYLMSIHTRKRSLGLGLDGQLADIELFVSPERIIVDNIEKVVIKYTLTLATLGGQITTLEEIGEVM